MSAGLAMGLMGIALRWVLVVSAAYEVFEQFVERKPWGKKLFQISGPESLPNALVDMVALLLGHHLGSRWNRTGKG